MNSSPIIVAKLRHRPKLQKANWTIIIEFKFGRRFQWLLSKLRFQASRWYVCCVDKGPDVAEKLGVGLLLGTMAQGILAKEISPTMYAVGTIILVISLILIVLAIYLSRED